MKTLQESGIRLKSYSNGNHKVTCPQCSHTRRDKHDTCLSVTIDGDGFVYNCHHCGWNGGSKNNVVYMKKTYRKPEYAPIAEKVDKVFSYLATRGISKETGEKLKVGLVKRYMPQTEKDEWCIAFPFIRNGEVVNVKYRTVEKAFAQEKDCEKVFYNIDSIKNQEFAIYTEGELDALSFIEAGFTSVVSVPDGAPNSEVKKGSKKLEYIENCADEILTVKKHYLAFDNDKNGRILTEEVATRLGKVYCWLIDFGDCKDANEVLQKHGKQALKRLFDDAKPFPLEGIKTFDNEAIEKVWDFIDNFQNDILNTGWESLDKLYRVKPKELTVVTGVPNSGKSEFIDCLLVNLATLHDKKFVFASLENPEEVHWKKLMEKVASTTSNNLRAKFTHQMAAFVNEHFYQLHTNDGNITLDEILEKTRQMIVRHGINGLVIDPHNQIEHKRPSNMSEHEYIGDVLRKVRAFAKNYNIHVWYVAHPRKVEGVPSLYDISGSANWANMADNGIVVHREHEVSSIHVKKIRFQPEVGKLGKIELRYNFLNKKYEVL